MVFSTFVATSYSQCNITETILVCDMSVIDGDKDGFSDGIINLYDEYTKQTGKTITKGTWFDPDYNFAIDEMSGDLYLWDLKESTTREATLLNEVKYYTYELYNADCPSGSPALTIQLHLGPYSSKAIPTIGKTDINVQICEMDLLSCKPSAAYDLNQTLLSDPSAHKNGIWSYLGTSANFIGIDQNKYLLVKIPYQSGPALIDQETFELAYTVPGVAPCNIAMETRVKISVVRDVKSGNSTIHKICEADFKSGIFNNDINLRDDKYLSEEDKEGVWLHKKDLTGEITNPGDSSINLKRVYDNLYAKQPRFGCKSYVYTYQVKNRSTVCPDKESGVGFILYESLRPFKQKPGIPEICIGDPNIPTIDLYDYIEFTTENGVLYDYPNSSCTNWTQISGPSDIGLKSHSGDVCDIDPSYSSRGTIKLSELKNNQAGTYVFEYFVSPKYNCLKDPTIELLDNKGCAIDQNDSNPCKSERALITINLNPRSFAGDDTAGLEFCESDFLDAAGNRKTISLTSLLKNETKEEDIYTGANGTWKDVATNTIIPNVHALPAIKGEQNFNYEYTTVTPKGCTDKATLSFKVFEYIRPGVGGDVQVCSDTAPFNLLSKLTGNPHTTGSWTGPEGFKSATSAVTFDPLTFKSGEYIYEVPANGLCDKQQAKLNITINRKPITGADFSLTVCKSDKSIDLLKQLDSKTDTNGVFVDLSNTTKLNGSVFDVTSLAAGKYDFEYQIQGHISCGLIKSKITIDLKDITAPKITPSKFCKSQAPKLADIKVEGSETIVWYASPNETNPLSSDELLVDGKTYYAIHTDSNGCKSTQTTTKVVVTPFGSKDCPSGVEQGISDNGDGVNDTLDMSAIEAIFPNYELKIFNRYGAVVYTGNINTPAFSGKSNAATTIGNQLPTGVYFYVLNPNNGVDQPTQGEIFLSR